MLRLADACAQRAVAQTCRRACVPAQGARVTIQLKYAYLVQKVRRLAKDSEP